MDAKYAVKTWLVKSAKISKKSHPHRENMAISISHNFLQKLQL